MSELGKSLAQARVARGLTLEDCERDTRISKRYLDALEREDWKVFPAPVYSRAFLRTYASYLGLDPHALMRMFRDQEEPPLAPLPEIRPASPTGSVNWGLAAVVVAVLLVAGGALFLSSRGGGGDDGAEVAAPSSTASPEGLGGGEQQPLGKPVPAIEEGVVPDLGGVRVDEAIGALAGAGVDFVVVESDAAEGQPGFVASQDPQPGAEAGGSTSITLLVPRG
jgi:transcriptional regulator with XRE-family HTH domain